MKTISVVITNIHNPRANELAIALDHELESIGIKMTVGKGYVYDETNPIVKSKVDAIIEKYLAYRELIIHIS